MCSGELLLDEQEFLIFFLATKEINQGLSWATKANFPLASGLKHRGHQGKLLSRPRRVRSFEDYNQGVKQGGILSVYYLSYQNYVGMAARKGGRGSEERGGA